MCAKVKTKILLLIAVRDSGFIIHEMNNDWEEYCSLFFVLHQMCQNYKRFLELLPSRFKTIMESNAEVHVRIVTIFRRNRHKLLRII